MFKKKIEILSARIKNFRGIRKMSSYKGKKVFSKSGEYGGRIRDVILKNDVMAGVIVNGKRKLFIDKEYFSSDTDDVVMLSIDPVTNIIGKQVFDADGKKIGRVIDVDRNTTSNTFSSLVVKKGLISKPINIPKEHIDILRKNVILKKKY